MLGKHGVGPKWKFAIATIACLSVLSTGTAFADNMMPTSDVNSCNEGSVCQADSIDHTYFFESSLTLMKGQTRNRWAQINAATVMDAFEITDPLQVVYSGNHETDVIYQQYENTAVNAEFGSAMCDDDSPPGYACDQFYVRYNKSQLLPMSFPQRKKVACHEAGHTLGLLHGSNSDLVPEPSDTASWLSCMKKGLSGLKPWIGAHNAADINNTYP